MISVSREFKDAIKSDVRDSRGYVEIIGNNYVDKDNYNITAYSSDPNTEDVAEISSILELNNNQRVINKYASFEKDYFLLDGSFILPSSENSNINPGYISEQISKEDDGRYIDGEFRNPIVIDISTNLTKVEGMTIYFDDDVFPTNFYYYNSGERIAITNNSRVCHIFDTITPNNNIIRLEIEEINTPNRRLRISEIDLGITNVYEGNDLKEFEVIEKVDILKQEMHINECNIILNNTNYQFNSVSPSGIAKYFNGAIVKPYIGILTKTKGVEYCPCGVFYLMDWKNNSQTTTTLYCKSFFQKMNENNSYFSQPSTGFMDIDSYIEYLFSAWNYRNYSYLGTADNYCIFDNFRTLSSQLEQLRELLIFSNLIGYVDRYGTVIMDNLKNEIVDTLSLLVLKNMPIINTKSLINQIIINEISCENIADSSTKTLLTKEFDITGEDNQFICFDFDESLAVSYTFSNIWPDYMLEGFVRGGFLFAFNVNTDFYHHYGDRQIGKTTVTLTQTGTRNLVKNPEIFNYQGSGEKIEIVDVLFNRVMQTYIDRGYEDIGMRLIDAMKNTANFIKENDAKYSIELEYNGDPSLEAKDLIGLETRYGIMNVRIQEHRLKFNGALSGSIKGVGN